MTETTTTKDKKGNIIDAASSLITNQRSRSLLFLIITFVLILLANGLLPLVSGQAHYTANPRGYTYGDYVELKKNNDLHDLTYGSKLKIILFEELYKQANPDLTPEELMLIEPPDNMDVSVYTVFFFQSPWWYIDTLVSVVSAVFLFYALFNYFITKAKDERLDHVEAEKEIRTLNKNSLDPDTFEPWMEDVFNKNRKIKQHIRNVKYDLKKLENKTDFKIRKKFKTYFENSTNVPEGNLLPVAYVQLTRKEKKYLEKKEELLTKLEPAYLENSVVDTAVKNFRAVQPGFVYSGVNLEGIVQDEYTAIKSDSEKIRSTLLSRIILSLAVTVSFASILTIVAINVNKQDPLWLILTIILKIVPLVLQIYFSLDYTNEFMDKHLLPNLVSRKNIGLRYLADMQRQKEQLPVGDY